MGNADVNVRAPFSRDAADRTERTSTSGKRREKKGKERNAAMMIGGRRWQLMELMASSSKMTFARMESRIPRTKDVALRGETGCRKNEKETRKAKRKKGEEAWLSLSSGFHVLITDVSVPPGVFPSLCVRAQKERKERGFLSHSWFWRRKEGRSWKGGQMTRWNYRTVSVIDHTMPRKGDWLDQSALCALVRLHKQRHRKQSQ